MFVIVTTYRARVGEEDAIIALHENKRYDQSFEISSYHSWQLLRRIDEPQEFVSTAQFMNEELAQAAIKDLAKDGWYSRLVSLMEKEPTHSNCTVVWQLR